MASSSPQERPRITPGSRAEIGALNALIVRVLGRAAGSKHPPNLFATLARHRRLFRAWLRFAGALMPRGSLPRTDTELVILRVAHNAGCEYEWRHHERLGRAAGLSAEEIDRLRSGPQASGWSGRQKLLLGAADELHDRREISDRLWTELAATFKEKQLIELVMLIGHYEMLASLIASLRIQPDRTGAVSGPGPLAGRRVLRPPVRS